MDTLLDKMKSAILPLGVAAVVIGLIASSIIVWKARQESY